MKLPSPENIDKLIALLKAKGPVIQSYESFKETKVKLAKYARLGAIAATQSGAQIGVTAAASASGMGIHVGMATLTLFPLGAALGPWLVAAAIARSSETIFALHDLRTSARNGGPFVCSCTKCVANLTYVIDRKEANTAILAVSVFTGGLAIIADRLNSIRKSFQKNRPKDQICGSMISTARGGCICAVASVFMLCDGSEIDAISMLCSKDGPMVLKSKW